MPGGGSPLEGSHIFAAVKFAGYAAASALLLRRYATRNTNLWKVGATRTGIGIALGAAYAAPWIVANSEPNVVLWYVGLLPVRIFEWGPLLRIFFEPGILKTGTSWKFSSLGTLWSYALDLVGVLAAFVVPGGFSIC